MLGIQTVCMDPVTSQDYTNTLAQLSQQERLFGQHLHLLDQQFQTLDQQYQNLDQQCHTLEQHRVSTKRKIQNLEKDHDEKIQKHEERLQGVEDDRLGHDQTFQYMYHIHQSQTLARLQAVEQENIVRGGRLEVVEKNVPMLQAAIDTAKLAPDASITSLTGALKDAEADRSLLRKQVEQLDNSRNIVSDDVAGSGNAHVSTFIDQYKKDVMTRESRPYIARRYCVDGGSAATATVQDVFAQSGNAILLKGEAGLGKTSSVENMLHLWANGHLLTDEYIVLAFKCKEVKHIAGKSEEFFFHWSSVENTYESNRKINLKDLKDLSADGKVCVMIDGIDEIDITGLINNEARQKIKNKILKNEVLNGAEHIFALMIGMVLRGTKLLITGRNSEIDRLTKIQDIYGAAFSQEKKRNVWSLMPFDDADVKQLACALLCVEEERHYEMDEKSYSFQKCGKVYARYPKDDLKYVPCFSKYLVSICNNEDEEFNFSDGSVSKTKLITALLLHLIREHGRLDDENFDTFQEILCEEKPDCLKIKNCIKSLAKISRKSLLQDKIQLIDGVQKPKDKDTVSFDDVDISKSQCEKLDLFYINKITRFKFSIEPQHLVIMEFLAASDFAAGSVEKWDEICNLSPNRKNMVIPMIAALLKDDDFTNDFMNTVMDKEISNPQNLEGFYSWLFKNADKFPHDYEVWVGYTNDERNPPFSLLADVVRETSIPPADALLPTTVKFISNYSNLTKSFLGMHDIFHIFGLDNISNEVMLESLLERQSVYVTLTGDVDINDCIELASLVSIQLNEWVMFKLKWLQINCQIEGVNINNLISSAEIMRVDANNNNFVNIINGVINRSSLDRLYLLCIRNIQSISLNDVVTLTTAVQTVKMLDFSGQDFTREQWKCFNHFEHYNTLEWLAFRYLNLDYMDACVDVVCKMKYITLHYVTMNKDAWECFAAAVHQSTRDVNNPLEYDILIFHRFHYNVNNYKSIDVCDVNVTSMSTGVIMLDLMYMVLLQISSDIISKVITSVQAVRLLRTELTDEQWEGVVKMIGDESCALRELWIDWGELPWEYLNDVLINLKLFRYSTHDDDDKCLEFIKWLLETKIYKQLVITNYSGDNEDEYREYIIFEGNASMLMDDREFTKVQTLMENKKYHNLCVEVL